VNAGETAHWVANFRVPIYRHDIEAIWEASEDSSSKLWPDRDIEQAKELVNKWSHTSDLLAEFNFQNIGRLFRKKLDDIGAMALRGERPEKSQKAGMI
jgi:hypothetical protein